MRKLPPHIAEKLLELSEKESIPNSSARHTIINELVEEGILERKGRVKKTLSLRNEKSLENHLFNEFGINDLRAYHKLLKQAEITRSDLVVQAGDSKIVKVRTFKGFLVNCYDPIEATLNNKSIVIHPQEGTFDFIYDFEEFLPASSITIVGIENPENFRQIEKQKFLFPDIQPLFVSRYPQNQSKDLIRWLQSIPNRYLHFGDFDLAGIGIYLNEYKKHLTDKASFLMPDPIEPLIKEYGSRVRYDQQKPAFDANAIDEETILNLLSIIHRYKKGLDQEILINKQLGAVPD